jgi:hypothetical protein
MVCLLALLLSAPIDAGKNKKKTLTPADLPEWVRRAAARSFAGADSDVVWLHEEREIEPLAAGGIRDTFRVAGKVLNSKGLSVLGDWAVYYHKGDEVVRLDAWTLRPDETVRRADPKDDVQDLPAIDSTLAFNDSRVRVIDAQGVVVGSIVAFEYETVDRLDVGAGSFLFGDKNRPTAYSRFAVRVPSGWGLEHVALRDEPLEAETAEGSVVYTAHDLSKPPREERSPSPWRMLPLVWAHWWNPDGSRGYRDWDAVGRWFERLSAGVLNDPGEVVEVAERLRPSSAEGLLYSLAQGFEFAARDIRYVSIDLGIGIGAGYRPERPAVVCANRYGDCKDKSFLLRAMAEAWGIKTYPVIVATRSRGPVVPEVPTPAQFNHCIAAVLLPDGLGEDLWSAVEVEGIGRVVFLDSTVRDGSPWALRWDIQGTQALLVHAEGATLVRLPVQPPSAGATRREVEVEIDEQGTVVQATLTERWSGTSATRVRSYYAGMTDEEHRTHHVENLQTRFPGSRITDYSSEGLDDIHAPVVEKTTIEGGRLGQRVGDLLILEPGGLGYGIWRGSLPRPPRKRPLYVGLPREEELSITIHTPEGWEPEEVRAPFELESEDLTAEANWSAGDGQLSYSRTARLLTSEIPADEYEEFRKQVKRLAGADGHAIVLVRR